MSMSNTGSKLTHLDARGPTQRNGSNGLIVFVHIILRLKGLETVLVVKISILT